jgi:hypothetical protein
MLCDVLSEDVVSTLQMIVMMMMMIRMRRMSKRIDRLSKRMNVNGDGVQAGYPVSKSIH